MCGDEARYYFTIKYNLKMKTHKLPTGSQSLILGFQLPPPPLLLPIFRLLVNPPPGREFELLLEEPPLFPALKLTFFEEPKPPLFSKIRKVRNV